MSSITGANQGMCLNSAKILDVFCWYFGKINCSKHPFPPHFNSAWLTEIEIWTQNTEINKIQGFIGLVNNYYHLKIYITCNLAVGHSPLVNNVDNYAQVCCWTVVVEYTNNNFTVHCTWAYDHKTQTCKLKLCEMVPSPAEKLNLNVEKVQLGKDEFDLQCSRDILCILRYSCDLEQNKKNSHITLPPLSCHVHTKQDDSMDSWCLHHSISVMQKIPGFRQLLTTHQHFCTHRRNTFLLYIWHEMAPDMVFVGNLRESQSDEILDTHD